MKLYELTQNYLNLLNLLENPDVPKDMIENALEEAGGDITEKVENTVKVIKTLENEVEAHKKEIDRLTGNKRTLENRISYLKDNLEGNLRLVGVKEVKTGLFTVSIKKNPQSIKIIDLKAIPKDYIKTTETVDKVKLKEDLKNGFEINGATLERTESLKIR